MFLRRDGIVKVLRRQYLHPPFLAAHDFHGSHPVALIHDTPTGVPGEAFFHQRGMVRPVAGVVDGHDDNSPPVSRGAGHQNPSGGLGKAGFHPVGARYPPQQLIVIGQIPIPHLDVFGGNGLVENGIFHGVGRQSSQILRRGIMAGAV